jgi:hypothetical protein
MKTLVVLFAAGLVAVAAGRSGAEPVALDKLPKAVAAAVGKRFPKAELTGASKAADGDKVVFEVSLKKDGKKIDVSLTGAGVITLIEQELAFKELPKAVARTFGEKYADAKYQIIESVTKVADGKEALEYYESILISGGKKWEVEVLPDGTFKGATEVKDKK